IVSYASEVKFDVLGVPEGPVVSAETASAMAAGARRVLGADVGVAVTGVAGPDPQDGREPGTVFVGLDLGVLDGDAGPTAVELQRPRGARRQTREFSVISALSPLRARPLALSGGGSARRWADRRAGQRPERPIPRPFFGAPTPEPDRSPPKKPSTTSGEM